MLSLSQLVDVYARGLLTKPLGEFHFFMTIVSICRNIQFAVSIKFLVFSMPVSFGIFFRGSSYEFRSSSDSFSVTCLFY